MTSTSTPCPSNGGDFEWVMEEEAMENDEEPSMIVSDMVIATRRKTVHGVTDIHPKPQRDAFTEVMQSLLANVVEDMVQSTAHHALDSSDEWQQTINKENSDAVAVPHQQEEEEHGWVLVR